MPERTSPDTPFPVRYSVDECPECHEIPAAFAMVIEPGEETRLSLSPMVSLRQMDRVMCLVLRPCCHEIPGFDVNMVETTVIFRTSAEAL